MFDFRPSAWFTTLIGSQTGRAIMAEVLVAAAGAAAAVLMAARTEPRSGDGRAAAKGRDMTALMKEAARSAASAAGAVLSGRALEAVGNAARSALKDQNQRSASTDFSDRTRDRDQAS